MELAARDMPIEKLEKKNQRFYPFNIGLAWVRV